MKRSTECERFEELLPLYIDGELSAEDAAGLTVHLAGCEECMQSLETYRALESSLDAMPGILPNSRAVSSMGSPRPSCVSLDDRNMAAPPN